MADYNASDIRKKAAEKALDKWEPDTSVTNEEAMRDPDNMPGKVKVLADEVEVASSPIGGENAADAYQTALKMQDSAWEQADTEQDKYWQQNRDTGLLLKKYFGDIGFLGSSTVSNAGVSESLLQLGNDGLITLSPEFKSQLEKAVSSWDEVSEQEPQLRRLPKQGVWRETPKETPLRDEADSLGRTAEDIKSLLGDKK
jgi:hypothetical protein